MIKKTICHFEEKNKTKYLLLDDVYGNKEVSTKCKKFDLVSKKKLIRLMVVKELNMGKIFKKLGLNLMMVRH